MPAPLGPSRPKRILYSILSVLIGVLIASCALSLGGNLQYFPNFDIALVFEQTLMTSLFALLFCVPGWLVSLGVVLSVTNFEKWRFLIFWATGTLIGPLVIFVVSVADLLTSPSTTMFFLPEDWMWLSAMVACLVTLIYMLLVRFDQRRARLRQPGSPAQCDPTHRTS